MTIKFFNYEIQINVTKKEKFPVVIDQTSRENDVQAIKSTDTFKNILAQAKQYRATNATK